MTRIVNRWSYRTPIWRRKRFSPFSKANLLATSIMESTAALGGITVPLKLFSSTVSANYSQGRITGPVPIAGQSMVSGRVFPLLIGKVPIFASSIASVISIATTASPLVLNVKTLVANVAKILPTGILPLRGRGALAATSRPLLTGIVNPLARTISSIIIQIPVIVNLALRVRSQSTLQIPARLSGIVSFGSTTRTNLTSRAGLSGNVLIAVRAIASITASAITRGVVSILSRTTMAARAVSIMSPWVSFVNRSGLVTVFTTARPLITANLRSMTQTATLTIVWLWNRAALKTNTNASITGRNSPNGIVSLLVFGLNASRSVAAASGRLAARVTTQAALLASARLSGNLPIRIVASIASTARAGSQLNASLTTRTIAAAISRFTPPSFIMRFYASALAAMSAPVVLTGKVGAQTIGAVKTTARAGATYSAVLTGRVLTSINGALSLAPTGLRIVAKGLVAIFGRIGNVAGSALGIIVTGTAGSQSITGQDRGSP